LASTRSSRTTSIRRAADRSDRVNSNLMRFTTACTIHRTRPGTEPCRMRKGRDRPRPWCRFPGRVARANPPAAAPPCGRGLSRSRQLLGSVTSNLPNTNFEPSRAAHRGCWHHSQTIHDRPVSVRAECPSRSSTASCCSPSAPGSPRWPTRPTERRSNQLRHQVTTAGTIASDNPLRLSQRLFLVRKGDSPSSDRLDDQLISGLNPRQRDIGQEFTIRPC
jgi:hypothetical protein